MLIDIRAHLAPAHSQRPAQAGDLTAYAQSAGVDRVLVLPRMMGRAEPEQREPDDNVAVLDACHGHDLLRPLYWVRPGHFDSNPHVLAGALGREPFAGVVFAPALEDYDADAALLDPYMQVLARAGRPAFFVTGREPAARPERVYTLARRHPQVRFVLLDAARGPQWQEAQDVVARLRSAGDGDMLLETAYATPRDVAAAARRCGAEGLLFSSDALHLGAEHATRVRAWVTELRATVRDTAAAQILCGNARRILQMDAEVAARLTS